MLIHLFVKVIGLAELNADREILQLLESGLNFTLSRITLETCLTKRYLVELSIIAWSIYLPADWVDATGTPQYQILWQLKGPDRLNCSPAISFLAGLTNPNHGGFYFEVESGDQEYGVNYYWERILPTNQSYELGHWVDWVMKVKFAKTATGGITIWRRDEGEIDFTQVAESLNIPTLQYKVSEGIGVETLHYWKAGIYRFKDADPPTEVISIFYYDGWARGTTFRAVVEAAF